jgi:glutamate dehydrogenase (NADP+)
MSDSDGFIMFEDGLSRELFESLRSFKQEKNGRLAEFADRQDGSTFHEGEAPWAVECDIAMPCATQNELDEQSAETLVENGVMAICEGANMPLTKDASAVIREAGILHAPGKAANAGGVAVSGLEQSQNAMRQSWSRERVDQELKDIIKAIHDQCVEAYAGEGPVNYVDGANLAGFKRVATAMHSFGVF